jgi:hypothetical protein
MGKGFAPIKNQPKKRNCSITTEGDRRRRSMGLLKNCASALIAE